MDNTYHSKIAMTVEFSILIGTRYNDILSFLPLSIFVPFYCVSNTILKSWHLFITYWGLNTVLSPKHLLNHLPCSDTIIVAIHILYMRKMRDREIKWLSWWSHTQTMDESESNLDYWVPGYMFLIITPHYLSLHLFVPTGSCPKDITKNLR